MAERNYLVRKTSDNFTPKAIWSYNIVRVLDRLGNKMVVAGLIVGIWTSGIPASGMPDTIAARTKLQAPEGLTPTQRKVSDEIISIFENDTPNLQYGYFENLGDGRGYTAGRGGFTTATGDFYAVVQLYCKANPTNPFTPYVDTLKLRAQAGDDSVDGLADLQQVWNSCANDPVFCQCQDQMVDQEAYQPALAHWKQLGCKTPLALLTLYDTVVEQGDANDPDGTPANIDRASKMAGGTPASGVSETEWLKDFMTVREQILTNPANHKTQEAWSESVDRVDALNQILLDGNLDLHAPIDFNVFGENWMVTDTGGFRTDQ